VQTIQSCHPTPKTQVRLLAAAAGLEVLSLKRVRIGGLRLPRTLKLGEYMWATASGGAGCLWHGFLKALLHAMSLLLAMH
jgi:hypothetical protein